MDVSDVVVGKTTAPDVVGNITAPDVVVGNVPDQAPPDAILPKARPVSRTRDVPVSKETTQTQGNLKSPFTVLDLFIPTAMQHCSAQRVNMCRD